MLTSDTHTYTDVYKAAKTLFRDFAKSMTYNNETTIFYPKT